MQTRLLLFSIVAIPEFEPDLHKMYAVLLMCDISYETSLKVILNPYN